MKLSHTLASAFTAALLAGSAQASTYVICEGGGPVSDPNSLAPNCAEVDNDFPNNLPGPSFDITGDTTIYGGITQLNSVLYQDAWTLNFGDQVYNATLSFVATTPGMFFDGTFTAGAVTESLDEGLSGEVTIFGLTGDGIGFVIDAAAEGEPRQSAFWTVEIAAVPLPAGMPLLLAGLAGFGLVARKKRKA